MENGEMLGDGFCVGLGFVGDDNLVGWEFFILLLDVEELFYWRWKDWD
jgi:hypothetical protein